MYPDCISSAECKKVVSDIFGKIELLMEYENIGLYAHFALFSRFLALLFSKVLSKMCSPCFGFTPTVHTKNSFKWNIKTN